MPQLSIRGSAYNDLQKVFGTYVDNASVKDNAVVNIAEKAYKLGDTVTLTAGAFDFKGNLFRRAAQTKANNGVREMFLHLVSDIFGDEGKIPKSVRQAMDFSSNFGGNGRPLKARHIRATMSAINTYFDKGSFEALDKMTHENLNFGQLTLDADGNVRGVDNRHSLRFLGTSSSTSPKANRAVREKVAEMLQDKFVSWKDSNVLALKAKIQEITACLLDGENRDKPLARADVCGMIDELKSLRSDQEKIFDSTLDILKRMGNSKGMFVSLGSDVKLSSGTPTPEENRAMRIFLANLITARSNLAYGSGGGSNSVVGAAKLILANDLTKGITIDEAAELLEKVKQSLPGSPEMRQSVENVRNKQEEINNGFLADLTKLKEEHKRDLDFRNKELGLKMANEVEIESTLKALKKLGQIVPKLKQQGVDILEKIKAYEERKLFAAKQYIAKIDNNINTLMAIADRNAKVMAGNRNIKLDNHDFKRQIAEFEGLKRQVSDSVDGQAAELEALGMGKKLLAGVFKTYKDRDQDHLFIEKIINFWQSALDDPGHGVELLTEDAQQVGEWNLQKKLSDELLGKYLSNNTIDKLGINDLNSKIEELDSTMEALHAQDNELENDMEAYEYIKDLDEKQDENFSWKDVKYAGENQVIKDLLTRFAETDEDDLDDQVQTSLNQLNDRIAELKDVQLPLNELKGELNELTTGNQMNRVKAHGTKAVLDKFVTESELKMQMRENEDRIAALNLKIRDLQQKIASQSSQNKAELANDIEALEYFEGLGEISDWREVAYTGKNPVIENMLKRFADEYAHSVDDRKDDRESDALKNLVNYFANDSVDDLVHRELDALKDRVNELKNHDSPLERQLNKLNDELKSLTKKGVELAEGRKTAAHRLAEQKQKLGLSNADEGNDLRRIYAAQNEYLDAHDQGADYLKYARLFQA